MRDGNCIEKTAEAERQEQECSGCCGGRVVRAEVTWVNVLEWEQRLLSGSQSSSGLYPGSDFTQHCNQVIRTLSGEWRMTEASTRTQVQSEECSGEMKILRLASLVSSRLMRDLIE